MVPSGRTERSEMLKRDEKKAYSGREGEEKRRGGGDRRCDSKETIRTTGHPGNVMV